MVATKITATANYLTITTNSGLSTSDLINIILAAIQLFSLIALVVYVIKTMTIAKETKKANKIATITLGEIIKTREIENKPNIICYIDTPFDDNLMYLFIKNIGKNTATNIKIEFDPLLKNKRDSIKNLPFIKEGISSLTPNQELKSFFDTTTEYFSTPQILPLKYNARILYKDASKNEYSSIQILDLNSILGLSYIQRKSTHEIAKVLEEINKSNKNIASNFKELNNNIETGIWINNFNSMPNKCTEEEWSWLVKKLLNNFINTWDIIYNNSPTNLLNIRQQLFNKFNQISYDIVSAISIVPETVKPTKLEKLQTIADEIFNITRIRFYIGMTSFEELNKKGDAVKEKINIFFSEA